MTPEKHAAVAQEVDMLSVLATCLRLAEVVVNKGTVANQPDANPRGGPEVWFQGNHLQHEEAADQTIVFG